MTTAPPSRPVIRGELVYLRPLEPADVDLVHAWYEDAEFAALMGGRPMSLAVRRARMERHQAEPREDVINLMVCRLEGGRAVGRVDIFEIDPINGSAGFGIGIGAAGDRGHGYGRDAVQAVCDYVFGQLRLERLWLTTDGDNTIAHHLYETVGFEREGIARHAYYQDGRYQDDVRMAILRGDWARHPRPKRGQRLDPMEPEPL